MKIATGKLCLAAFLLFLLFQVFNPAKTAAQFPPDKMYYLSGENFIIGKRYKNALEQFRNLKEKYPRSKYRPKALFLTGICYEKLQQPDKAEETYLRLLNQNPVPQLRNEALYRFTQIYKDKGDYDRMLSLIRILILSNPPDSEWTNRLSCAPLWKMQVDGLKDFTLDKDNNLYILQLQLNNPVIKKYSLQGKLLKEIKLQDLPSECPFPKKQIDKIRLEALAVDEEGNFYLSPEYPYGVLKFSMCGDYLDYFSKGNAKAFREMKIVKKGDVVIDGFGYYGEEEENSCYGPCAVAADKYGNIYAGDAIGPFFEQKQLRLQIFDNYGRLWEKFPYGGVKIRVAPCGVIIMNTGTQPKGEIAVFAPSKLFFLSELIENDKPSISKAVANLMPGMAWKPGIADKINSDYFKAVGYLKQGKVKEADTIFQDLICNQPDDFRLLSGISRVYQRLKEYDKSAVILNKLLKLYSERYDLYLRLAWVREKQELYKEAEEIYNRGIKRVKEHIAWKPNESDIFARECTKLKVLIGALFTFKEEKDLYPKKELRLTDEKGGWHADILPEYKLLFSFGGKGSEPGKLNIYNNGKIIAVDSKDRILVADYDRIQIFSSKGEFISQIKVDIFPVMAVDSKDRIFTAEKVREINAQRVAVFSQDGQLVDSSKKVWPVIFDLAFRDSNLLVLDNWSQEITILDSGLGYLTSFDMYTDYLHSKIVVDKVGNVYLSDTDQRKVKVYDPEGNYLYAFPLYGRSPAIVSNDVICTYGPDRQLVFYNLRNKKLIREMNLEGISVASMVLDSKNRLIIADGISDKIFVFEPLM